VPGMFENFDRHVREQAARDAEQELYDQQWRQRQGMLGRASMERILDLLQGGTPTRESTEEWMARQQMMRSAAPRRGMLEQHIDGRIIPRRGPPRRRMPPAISVRG
jgi:hypothetical protein